MELPSWSFIELFAGVGGFRVGLEAVGGRCVWASEIDEKAREAYAANHVGRATTPFYDVRKTELKQVPPFRVLTAGFPCQDFTTIGQQAGLEGARGSLFFEVLRFVRSHRPDAVLLENVRGLVTMQKGAVMATVLQSLRDLGYHVTHQLINSSVFVPQYRNRVYIVAFREESAFRRFAFPPLPRIVPVGGAEEAPSGGKTEEVAGKTAQSTKKPERHSRTLGEVLERFGQPLLPSYSLSKLAWRRAKESKDTQKYGLQQRLVQEDGIADTLLASYRQSVTSFAQFVPLAAHASARAARVKQGMRRPRWFTPRECHRMMGFPEDFVPHVSPSASYHQMGNAVTPSVIALLGGHIMAALTTDGVEAANFRRTGYSAALGLAVAATPVDTGRREALLNRRVLVAKHEAALAADFDGPLWQLVAMGATPVGRFLQRYKDNCERAGTDTNAVCPDLVTCHHAWRWGVLVHPCRAPDAEPTPGRHYVVDTPLASSPLARADPRVETVPLAKAASWSADPLSFLAGVAVAALFAVILGRRS